MRSRTPLAILAAAAACALPFTSRAQLAVYDGANHAVNTTNYLTQLQSWTSSLSNEAKGLSQGMTQINQGAQQIQQYSTMLSYIGNPRALANAVGLGPLMNLEGQLQNLYGQFSNVHDLQSLTSATGAMSNTMNGLYPAVNPNNVINAQAFQRFQLVPQAGQQFQNLLRNNNQYQQQLAGQISQAVRDVQNAPNQAAQQRALATLSALQAAQKQSQDAITNAIDAEIDAALEQQAMNDRADEAAYQEAAKTYLAAQAAWYNNQVQSLEKLGTPGINIPQPTAPVQNSGAQYKRVGIVPSAAPL
jgi:hypothetical protein